MLLLTVVRSCEVYTCPIIWGTVLILQPWWIVVTGSQSIPICWKLLVHSPCHQKPPTIKLSRGHILHHPTLETPWHHSCIASVVPRYTQHAHHTTVRPFVHLEVPSFPPPLPTIFNLKRSKLFELIVWKTLLWAFAFSITLPSALAASDCWCW